jgi:hypothetical protein
MIVSSGSRWTAKIGAGLAVDGHPAGRDQLIAMTARTDAGRSEKAIDTHPIVKSS